MLNCLVFHLAVPGECSSEDVQTLGVHGHDGSGKTSMVNIYSMYDTVLKAWCYVLTCA